MANPRSVIINLVANDNVSKVVGSVGKQFDKLNGQMKKAAAPAMAAAGIAAGGAFVSGLTGMIKLDDARGKLEAQLGLTKAKSAEVGKVAGSLYASAYGDSMDDVNAAVSSVIRNMDGMREASAGALKETTARAMTVAQVLGEDVGGVTAAVSQMLRTGLAKSSEEAFDIMTAATQRGANKAEDLLDTITEYGTQFRALGLSGQQAMGIIQQGLAAGARDGDTVADTLKEINDRVLQGDAAAGIKALGLNAQDMAKKFAAGGPQATGALDSILDKLRGVQDPAKKAQLGAAIAGEKFVDMQKALFALDPSTAVKALGQVSGSADKAGQALGSTAAARFEAFKRSLQQDVQNALAGTVVWFQKHETVAKVLAVTIGVLTAAYVAYNVVAAVSAARTAIMTEGTAAYLIVSKTAALATKIWAAGQWLLNAALTANPVGLVVIAIMALVAAVVIAYKNSQTFRTIVQAAWEGIKNAAASAWSAIQPIFTAIKYWIVSLLIPYYKMLWAGVQATWQGIVAVIAWAWPAIKTYWAAVKLYITVLVNAFKALWIYIQIAWKGIQLEIRVAWAVIKPIWAAVKAYITGILIPNFKLIWSVVKVVWAGLSATISSVWNGGIKPAFNALRAGLHTVQTAFSTAVSAIRRIWDGLKSIAKTPVNFVIDVYNRGIVGLFNKVASFAGIKTRLTAIPKLAQGGTLNNPAAAGPMKTSGPMAIVGEGRRQHPEYVIPTDPAHRARAQALWAAAGQDLGTGQKWLTGSGAMGGEGMAFAGGGTLQALAGGGVIGSFVQGLKDFAFGDIQKAASGVLGKVLGGSVPGGGVFRDAVAGIPPWIKNSILGWIKAKVGMGGGGPGMAKALNWAKAQSGKPYLWGGVGPGGYDCSGFMSAITNVIHGKNPYSRLFSTHSFGGSGGPGGFVRNAMSGFRVGVTNAGVGHMAGTLLGVNVESNGSQGVHYGPGARGANNGLFGSQYGLKADTGALTLQPGWNPPTFNGTGRPELLTTARPEGGNTYNITVNVPPNANEAAVGARIIKVIQAYEQRNGRTWRART